MVAYAGEPLGAIYRTARPGGRRQPRLAQPARLRATEWLKGAPPELRSLNRPSDLE